jgi:dynein heavy chain
VNIAL